MLIIILFVTCLFQSVQGGPKYTVGSALRHLAKGVFTKSLLPGDAVVEESLYSASVQDSSDCLKRLICELQAKRERAWDEERIVRSIPSTLSYKSSTIQLELAAKLGNEEPDQCKEVYKRCVFESEDIMTLLRQRGASFKISTTKEYDCTVIFLWSKKTDEDNTSNTIMNLLPPQDR